MRVNLSGRGTPDREGALPVRRSCRERCDSASELAKSDPRAPRRRSRSQRCIFTLDWGRLWAFGNSGSRSLPSLVWQTPGRRRTPTGTRDPSHLTSLPRTRKGTLTYGTAEQQSRKAPPPQRLSSEKEKRRESRQALKTDFTTKAQRTGTRDLGFVNSVSLW